MAAALPDLEGGDGAHQWAEAGVQDRPDPDLQRRPLAGLGFRGVADGVDGRGGGEQAGEDGQAPGAVRQLFLVL
ncbi:hypothetical protein [Candidatus Protofrankia californiensis]|uniref:hypothetical protein n=1 Tax=Candidatus Protofrankia californiensis TaxID=1839754 RepID=UPI0013ECC4B1|nr:hypothetical protein [Candidatus Protofrankia californiensis]